VPESFDLRQMAERNALWWLELKQHWLKRIATVAAQPGIAADRFAREIVRFLKSFCAAHSQQLNANPLGCSSECSAKCIAIRDNSGDSVSNSYALEVQANGAQE